MISVIAAILIKDKCVFIARRKEDKHLGGFWEFPGGKLEANESPELCLERELYEEFSIRTRTGAFFFENEFTYEGRSPILLKAYYSSFVSGSIKLTDHSEIAWVDIGDLGHYDFAPADIAIVERLMSGFRS
jgi:8-oxo-dGTP diphosphatase